MTIWQPITDKLLYFGPFAVSLNHQKKGIGKLMLQELDRLGLERNMEEILIKVVNHRLDLIPWYQSLGYVIVGTTEWPADYSHYLTKPTHFLDMIRPIPGGNKSLPISQLQQDRSNQQHDQVITIHGSCCCKSVQYYITNEPRFICYCHCSICRKISGSLFSPWITILSSQLHITSSPQYYRQFCNICGTHLFFHPIQVQQEQQSCCTPHELDISFGTIEENDQQKYKPTVHIWYD